MGSAVVPGIAKKIKHIAHSRAKRSTRRSPGPMTSQGIYARLSYFGLTAGLPPGMPGGGITGIVEPVAGGVCLISGSILAGGVITPPDRFRSELRVPLTGGTAGVVG